MDPGHNEKPPEEDELEELAEMLFQLPPDTVNTEDLEFEENEQITVLHYCMDTYE